MTAWRTGEARRAGIAESRRKLNLAVSEADFQRTITDMLDAGRYLWFHDHDSRRNRAGLPDIIAVKAPRLIFIECKTSKGIVSGPQQEWLDELARCTSVEAHLFRPDDGQRAQEVLL